MSTPNIPPKTPRHFAVGTRVTHKEYGLGTVTADKRVRFDSGTMGTAFTRVHPVRHPIGG